MIYTSYFANIRKFPSNVIPVAICAKLPDWYTGLQYRKLSPKYGDLMKYKNGHDEDGYLILDYIKGFNNNTLKCLNPLWVLNDLNDLIGQDTSCPIWENPDAHIALVCYEKPGMFCHRQLVAEWLRQYGVTCEEWEDL